MTTTTDTRTFTLDQPVWYFDGSFDPREGVICEVTPFPTFTHYKVNLGTVARKPWILPASDFYLYARPADRERLTTDVETRIDCLQRWLKSSENALWEEREALELLDNATP